ncbi:MAG: prepilin peptidase [Elusimicrobiota bacterium]
MITANDVAPAFWTALGLCLGSFINVVIHRLPRGRSLVRPRSHCPRCRKQIAFYDNIPLVSYVLLRGRCRHCGKPISGRYPLVEAIVGGSALGLWWRWQGDWLWVLLALCALAALTAVAFIDLRTYLIPNELSLGLLAAGIIGAPVNPFFSGGALWRIAVSLGSAAGGFLLCWAVAEFGRFLFKKEAMGGGDIKLLAAVGAWTGALGAFDCLLLGSLAGSIYGGALLLKGKVRRQDPIPFGPFLSLGAAFNFFYLLPFGFPFGL